MELAGLGDWEGSIITYYIGMILVIEQAFAR